MNENYRGGKAHVMCPICNLHYDNQNLCLQCPEIKKEINCSGEIREIYENSTRKELVETMTSIMSFRKKYIENG